MIWATIVFPKQKALEPHSWPRCAQARGFVMGSRPAPRRVPLLCLGSAFLPQPGSFANRVRCAACCVRCVTVFGNPARRLQSLHSLLDPGAEGVVPTCSNRGTNTSGSRCGGGGAGCAAGRERCGRTGQTGGRETRPSPAVTRRAAL